MHFDKEILENILQKCSDGIAVISKQGIVKYLSPAVEEIFGYDRSELSTVENWANLTSLNQKDREQTAEVWAGDIASEDPPERIYQIIRKDGEKRWYRFHMSHLGDEDVVISIQDVTVLKKSEESAKDVIDKYSLILNSLGDAIHVINPDLEILYINKIFKDWCDALGLETEKEGKNIFDVFSFLPDIVRSEYEQIFEKGEVLVTQETQKVSGKDIVTETRKIPVLDDGKVVQIITVVKDITHSKKIEETLKETEEKYQIIFETTGNPVLIIEEDTTISLVNKEFEKLSGYTKEEIEGKKSWTDFIIKEDLEKMKKYHDARRKNGRGIPKKYECRCIYKDGAVRNVHMSVDVIPGTGKTIASLHDITERKKAERMSEIQRDLGIELSTTTSISKAMEHLLNIMMHIEEIDCGGVYVVNGKEGSLKMIFSTGLSPEFSESVSYFDKDAPQTKLVMKGKPVYMHYQEEEMTRLNRTRLKEGLRGLAVIPIKHGKKVISVINIGSHTVDDFSISTRLAIETIASQIGGAIARINLQEALREEKELLDITLKSIGDGVITTDTKGSIVFINKVAEGITGYKNRDVTGKPLKDIFELLNSKDRKPVEDPVSKVLKSKSIVSLSKESLLISKDGTERLIADSGAPIKDKRGQVRGVVIVFRDITRKRKTENELQKAQKLESIGILAGGIAHDFNNILTAIVGSIYLAKTFVDPKEEIFEVLFDAEKASLQAKSLTQQLLTFSRGGLPVKKTIAIEDVLKESIDFSLRGSNLKCRYNLQENLWNVRADFGQISQVISNLVINAQQAMPEGGDIVVFTENITVTKKMKIPLKEGRFVKISIQDKGKGILKEHINKIFDPFFTTKKKGSGLGLAITYSIIKKHGGIILVDSKIGKGTTFNIYLPASDKKVQEIRKPKGKGITGGGRILLVDDEDMILRVGKRLLKYLGYEVEVATDGAKAINIYEKEKKSGKPFDVIIIDLTIPGGMGGKETIKRLKKIDPDVKMIVSSGYSQDVIMSQYKEYGFCGIITKPYSIDDVSVTLAKVIKS